MWNMKFFWNCMISKKWSKSRCESSRNCGKKKISKIVKISNFHGVCNKIRLSTQCKHNSKHFSEYHIVFNTPGTLQILTSKFGFTVALKPQRNWKNSKIVHFSYMDPHKFRTVYNSAIPILWGILGIQDSILKKIWDFLLRATKFSVQFSKTSVFEENHLIHLSGQKMCLVGANQKKTSAGRNKSIYAYTIQFWPAGNYYRPK